MTNETAHAARDALGTTTSSFTALSGAYYLAAFLAAAYGLWKLFFDRPALPKNAPRAWTAHDWPVVGSTLAFYGRRRDMVMEAIRGVGRRNFSFYLGKKIVVCLSGEEGRKSFYDNRELNFSAGFVELLVGMPFTQQAEAQEGEWARYFNKTLLTLMRQEALERRLPVLCNDAINLCDKLAAATPSEADPEWSVTDAFDSIYCLISQMLSRIVGATEIADDPVLTRKLNHIFERFEASTSTTSIIFPWLRVATPAFFLRMVLGTKLYMMFQKIIQDREKTGRREDDALQWLLDQRTPLETIIKFQISAVWAALLTTGANGTWHLVMFAQHPDWQSRCRTEIERVIASHRTSPDQSARDVLASLTLAEWESEFPVVNACLRESMRITLPGAVFRRNISDHDIPIGNSGEVIPPGAFAAYHLEDVHFDPELYPEPYTYDPGRFLGEGDRIGKAGGPHSFVGWGSGRHPCLGTRLAKLEITILTAYFLAAFEYELSHKDGSTHPVPTPVIDRNKHTACKSDVPVYIRYKPRREVVGNGAAKE